MREEVKKGVTPQKPPPTPKPQRKGGGVPPQKPPPKPAPKPAK